MSVNECHMILDWALEDKKKFCCCFCSKAVIGTTREIYIRSLD